MYSIERLRRALPPTGWPCLLGIGVLAASWLVAGAAGQVLPPHNPFAPGQDDPFAEPAEEMEVLRGWLPVLRDGYPGMPIEGDPEEQSDQEPLTEEEKLAAALVQKYVQMQQLERTPGRVIQALADRSKPQEKPEKPSQDEKAADDAAAKQFYLQVVVGDWDGVRDHLAGLPENVALKVYGHLLRLLANRAGVVLFPDEILSLADASPSDLSEKQLASLGRLLRQSLPHVAAPRAMLARLQSGTERLGGDDPEKRLAAARLLLGAGMLSEVPAYLPPLDQALENQDVARLNLHAAYYQAKDRQQADPQARRRAWDLTGAALGAPAADEELRSETLARAVALMPLMPEQSVSIWLEDLFTHHPDLGMPILAQAARRVQTTFAQKHVKPREEALAAQQRVVHALLAVAGDDLGPWSPVIEMLTVGWINEAQYSVSAGTVEEELPDEEELARLLQSSQAEMRQAMEMVALHQRREIPPMPAKALLPLCPEENWCRAIRADMAEQVRRLTGEIAAAVGDRQRAFAMIEHFAASDPEVAGRLAERYLATWTARLAGAGEEEDPFAYRMSPGYMMSYPRRYYGHGYGSAEGIPLTRARQVRNLAELAELLGSLKALSLPPLKAEVLVGAFDGCHSPAEVYRKEDIERVFGPPDALPAEMILQLVSTMRAELAGQWRAPQLQDLLGTQRTDEEHVAEVVRGYELAMHLLDGPAEKDAGNVELLTLLATVYFDQSEFLYGQQVDLKTYVSTRDQAFAAYGKAAELYAQSIPQLAPDKQSVQIYRQWFQSALGASDLAYLTRQDRPDKDQIDRIAAAIRGLGEEAADRHVKMFAEAITESTEEVPPQLKPHYLREALRVVGDHPAGDSARKRLRLYDDLLGELQVHLALDGSAEVGYERPFGVHMSIRSTKAVLRESGGFTHLLEEEAYSRSTGEPVNTRERIEETVREKLGEFFQIETLRFHEPQVKPRGFGRTGWAETPLGYLVLRAKDPSVDRIPVVHVDLEFNDGAGMVLLPVTSQVVLIDARDPNPPPRPFDNLTIRQVLDDRGLDEGKVRLEITASANGLIPDLEQLLDVVDRPVEGFRVAGVQELGEEVDSLDASGDSVKAVCRRRWAVDLRPAAERPVTRFAFPRAKDLDFALEYQRFDDVDIVEVGAVVPIRTFALAGRGWLWLIGGLGTLILLLSTSIIAWRYRRHRRAATAEGAGYRRPDPLTPFSLLGLLKRMHADESLNLSENDRRALADTIADLERRFFGRDAAEPAAPDLTAILDRWLTCAVDGRRAPQRVG